MASKKKKDSPGSSTGTVMKRKAISMEVKSEIIKRHEEGESCASIGRKMELARTTVVTIVKDRERILNHIKGSTPMSSTCITKQRSQLIIEMERLLVLWLDDQRQRRMPVSLLVMQEKARRLFETLKSQQPPGSQEEQFQASKGWFNRFKARANLHNIRIQGEAASADVSAASEFPAALAEIIRDGAYCD